MSTSKNQNIQALMDEVEKLDPAKHGIEEKLNEIARLVKLEQEKMKAALTGNQPQVAIAGDPADEFACEGCQ